MPRIPAQVYFRIIIITIVRDAVVSAFSILDFVSNSEILRNVAAQFAGYGFGVFTNRPFDPVKLFKPQPRVQ